jgi:dihydrofolate reductase
MECHPPRARPIQRDRRLKDQPGKDLIKYGTSRLDDTLVKDHLIDEFRFWIRPVVAGAGQRLFEHVDTSGLHLRLTHERRLENGSVILAYAPGRRSHCVTGGQFVLGADNSVADSVRLMSV